MVLLEVPADLLGVSERNTARPALEVHLDAQRSGRLAALHRGQLTLELSLLPLPIVPLPDAALLVRIHGRFTSGRPDVRASSTSVVGGSSFASWTWNSS